MKVVFVCTGNTCRSPMAEHYLKSRLKQLGIEGVKVSSSGLFASDQTTDEKAITALKKIGINARAKKAKQFSVKSVADADFVFTMTMQQRAQLRLLCGDKAHALGEFSDGGDVSDPYMSSQVAYDFALLSIKTAVDNFIKSQFLAL